MSQNQNLTQQQIIPSHLADTINSLSNSLKTIAPANSQTQLITYTLIATAITGIFIYHYIKSQENS